MRMFSSGLLGFGWQVGVGPGRWWVWLESFEHLCNPVVNGEETSDAFQALRRGLSLFEIPVHRKAVLIGQYFRQFLSVTGDPPVAVVSARAMPGHEGNVGGQLAAVGIV